MSKETTQKEIPARVQAAQAYVSACHAVTDPFECLGLKSAPGRDLDQRERATYDAALSALRLYFLGEMDYTDSPDEDEDETKAARKRRKRR